MFTEKKYGYKSKQVSNNNKNSQVPKKTKIYTENNVHRKIIWIQKLTGF